LFFKIYVPVFNGAGFIDDTLRKIEKEGYLPNVKVIDDASTDDTPKILKRWKDEKGIEYVSMEINGQKIASIKKVLEAEERDGTLPEYVILHDADSFLKINNIRYPNGNGKFQEAIEKVIEFMEKMEWAAIAFQDVPLVSPKSTWVEKFQYKEYFWDRVTHYHLGKKGKMRCIPGAGGIFKAKPLLEALRQHSLKHDGDDMETTAILQRLGYKVGYYSPHVLRKNGFDSAEYPEIIVYTRVPNTFFKLLKQRIRWTKGACDVYLKEGRFYLSEIKLRTRLGVLALCELVKLITYPGWYQAAIVYPLFVFPVSVIATGILNVILMLLNPEYKDEFKGDRLKIFVSTLIYFFPLAAYSFVLDTFRMPGAYWRVIKERIFNRLQKSLFLFAVFGKIKK
jgi:cellulose synthase/poly-beta-1,6-N-acetylglucosamine synthase-like glycosyltransferase